MINIESFEAGNYVSSNGYKYFKPTLVNTEWTWTDARINKLLETASFELGQLNSFARLVPNVDLFIHSHMKREAVISSRIEGTQTEFDESFLQKDNVNPERRDDWQEVQNYTSAMNKAIQSLVILPVSSRLILKAHEELMQGVRGEMKNPGEYRRSQNWIGGQALKMPHSYRHITTT